MYVFLQVAMFIIFCIALCLYMSLELVELHDKVKRSVSASCVEKTIRTAQK